MWVFDDRGGFAEGLVSHDGERWVTRTRACARTEIRLGHERDHAPGQGQDPLGDAGANGRPGRLAVGRQMELPRDRDRIGGPGTELHPLRVGSRGLGVSCIPSGGLIRRVCLEQAKTGCRPPRRSGPGSDIGYRLTRATSLGVRSMKIRDWRGRLYSGSRLHDAQSGVSEPAEDVLGRDLS